MENEMSIVMSRGVFAEVKDITCVLESAVCYTRAWRQVTWTTPEMEPPLLTTTPHQEDVLALDRFNVHRCLTRWVFSGTGLELTTCLP
ncbi:hypothetical protein TNCV_1267501 [Trichonephila clavipes]|nr:hypothetical protein TNCV_1267501 [Trichonephila clavipes]